MDAENYNQDEKLVQEVSMPLFESKGWIKFLGILMIFHGLFLSLSIIGLLIAWLPVWMGVLLIKVSTKIEQAKYSGNKTDMLEAQKNLATYFTISGIVALISIIIIVLFFVLILTTGILANLTELGSEYY